VQVSYSIADDITRKREIWTLVKLAKNADLYTLEIVTSKPEFWISKKVFC
jgi:hypothetical protein